MFYVFDDIWNIDDLRLLQFINHLVPQDLKINDTLSVQETSFEEYCIQFAGKDLILVDTPSANTGRNVFKKAAQWLSDRCHRCVIQSS